MLNWVVVDEFGFVVDEGFLTKEDAEKARQKWESTDTAKAFDLKYSVELLPL